MNTQIVDDPGLESGHASTREEIQIPGVPRDTAIPEALRTAAEGRPATSGTTKRIPLALPILGIAAITGVGMLLVSPFSPFHAHHQLLARTVALPHIGSPVLAPAANLATASSPKPVRVASAAPRPKTITKSDEVNDILQLGGHDAGEAAPARPVAVTSPAAAIVTAAATAPVAARAVTPIAVHAAIPAPLAPVTSQSAKALSDPPYAPDPMAQAASLHAAPMTDAQQVQVLQLVTELGTVVRDQRAELAQLRTEQASLRSTVTTDLSGFDRRLSAAEAHGSMAAAMGAPVSDTPALPAPIATAATTPRYRQTTARVVVRSPAPSTSVPPIDVATARYHVTAASPGLAMVSVLDGSGEETRQFEVAPGDSLPGYGRVLSIGQRGTTWQVKAERGSIE